MSTHPRGTNIILQDNHKPGSCTRSVNGSITGSHWSTTGSVHKHVVNKHVVNIHKHVVNIYKHGVKIYST